MQSTVKSIHLLRNGKFNNGPGARRATQMVQRVCNEFSFCCKSNSLTFEALKHAVTNSYDFLEEINYKQRPVLVKQICWDDQSRCGARIKVNMQFACCVNDLIFSC